MRRLRATALLTLLVSIATVVAAAPVDAAIGDPTRLCPGVAAAGELANPAQRDPYVTYVPAGATLRITGTADVLGRDWTGGWQSIFFIEVNDDHNMVYDLLGSYYGGPHYDQGFGGAWTNFGPDRDVSLVVGNDFGSSIRYTFTVILEAAAGVSGCSSLPAQARVMTWNVAIPPMNEVRQIAKTIIDGDVDLAGLQEIQLRPFEAVLARLELVPGEHWSGYWRANEDRCWRWDECKGNGILTRLAVGDYADWKLGDNTQHRGQRLEVAVGEQRLLFYNVHIAKNPKGNDPLGRQDQVEALLNHVDADQATFALPHVIGGDFNSRPWHCAMRDMRSHGLRDAWAENSDALAIPHIGSNSCGAPGNQQSQPCGYRAKKGVAPRTECGFTRGDPGRYPLIRIDYLYTSADVTATQVEIDVPPHPPQLINGVSDHLPVVATMTIGRPGVHVE